LGVEEKLDVDFFNVRLDPGDIVLLCSDGLTNMIEDEEIRMILQGQRDLVEKAESLVDAANDNGGKDNIAVVLVDPYGDNR
jgi:protein phosphatase